MLNIPTSLREQFQACLQQHGIPLHAQTAYLKWLRYYLDFCHKYHFAAE